MRKKHWNREAPLQKSVHIYEHCSDRFCPPTLSVIQVLWGTFSPQSSQVLSPSESQKNNHEKVCPKQGTFNWRAPSYPNFIQNYFLLKRMFDFFDNRDKCRLPGFLRGNIYTSCISMLLLDHFANKNNTLSFSPSLSLPLSLSHFLPFPPWVSTLPSSYPGYQDKVTVLALSSRGLDKQCK